MMMRSLVLAVCLCNILGTMAQQTDSVARRAEFGAELTSELQTMTRSGKCNFVNLLRLHASVPLSNSLSVDMASVSIARTDREGICDDLQAFSNIEAENTLFALSVCGINWDMDDSNSLFVGIRNMNEDYFASPVTAFFTNSSCGIYPTISANYDIANYPVSSLGVHYRYEGVGDSVSSYAVQASLYNGTAYNRFTGREHIFRVCPRSDGVFGLTQIEYHYRGSSYFLGNSVYYNKNVSVTPWFYAEQRLSSAVSMIAGYSHAFAKEVECEDFVGVGLHYGHRRCEVGFFSDYARFACGREYATEVTLKYNFSSSLYVQPVLNLISTSLEDSDSGSSFRAVASLRMGIAL